MSKDNEKQKKEKKVNPEVKVKPFNLSDLLVNEGETKAVSFLTGTTGVKWPEDLSEGQLAVFPYAVFKVRLNPQDFVSRWYDFASGTMRSVVTSVISDYFTETDPVAIQTVLDAFISILQTSATMYSMMLYLYKCQNRCNYRDAQDRKVYQIFNGKYFGDLEPILAEKILDDTTLEGSWGISNNSWNKDYLAKCRHIYLSPVLRNELEFLVAQVFKMEHSDATLRFVDVVPNALIGDDTTYPYISETNFLNQFNALNQEIESRLTLYPFLTEVLAAMGLDNKSTFNFLRDKDGQKLDCYDDKDGHMEALFYSNSVGVEDNWHGYATSDSVRFCVYSRPTDEAKLSGAISISPRISILVTTLLNATRGCMTNLGTYFMQIIKRNNNLPADIYCQAISSGIWGEDVGLNATQLGYMINTNMLNCILDTPCNLEQFIIKAVTDGEVSDKEVRLKPGLADYYISQGDVDAVVAQAQYDIIFSNSKIEQILDLTTTSLKVPANTKA